MQPIAEHHVNYIRKLHNEGFNNSEIAKITRLSRRTIQRTVKRMKDDDVSLFSQGLKRRRSGSFSSRP